MYKKGKVFRFICRESQIIKIVSYEILVQNNRKSSYLGVWDDAVGIHAVTDRNKQ